MTRARARRAFSHGTTRDRRNMDFFCLTPNGIRVAYPSPGMLRKLSPKARKQVRGRVILALTANRHYSLKGGIWWLPAAASACSRSAMGRSRRSGSPTGR